MDEAGGTGAPAGGRNARTAVVTSAEERRTKKAKIYEDLHEKREGRERETKDETEQGKIGEVLHPGSHQSRLL